MDDLPAEKLATLLAEFSRSGVRELHVRSADFEVYLCNDPDSGGARIGTAPRAAAASLPPSRVTPTPSLASAPPLASRTQQALPDGAIIVTAPNLGTFYRAPKPGAEDYVQIGSTISVGDELCLIEVMKLFTAVRSDVAGRIHAVLADDGAMVEAGQPLFAVTRA